MSCMICGGVDGILYTCKDEGSWKTLYLAAKARDHTKITSLSSDENHFPDLPIKYHPECRSSFTHKKSLLKVTNQGSEEGTKSEGKDTVVARKTRGGNSLSSPILPSTCIFCKREKYKNRVREKLINCVQFRADVSIKDSALKHIAMSSQMAEIAQEILVICDKDLISSEAKYHASCYKVFLKILYEPKVEKDPENDEESIKYCVLFESVEKFCEELNESPRVEEFKTIRNIVNEKASELHLNLSPSYQHNLLRKVSSHFPDLRFVQRTGKSVLMYPSSLNTDDLVVKYYNLKLELDHINNVKDDDEKNILQVAKLLHEIISSHPECISWPPAEKELQTDNVMHAIPPLLDVFCSTLLTGKFNNENISQRLFQRKNSIAQDMVYCASNGRIKTPKSVLFPCVVKALCNNIEIAKLINTLGHGINYNLIREIETEYALSAINAHKEKRVVIPEEEEIKKAGNQTAVMVADNIDNLERTTTGHGTSHRVNSILITRDVVNDSVLEQIDEVPVKRKCRRALTMNDTFNEIPDYYAGRRVDPGELKYILQLNESAGYKERKLQQNLNFVAWIALRTLKTLPSLLVPGWTGYNIVIRKDIVIINSKVSYLDTIDAPATDLKTAFEVLCRGNEIRDRLNLKSVVCVFDQAFYAKAAEVQWKNRELFGDIVLMLGGFHLLMMLMGVLGTRYGDAGLREIAVQSGVVVEGSIDKALSGKDYNRAIRMHKLIYEALNILLYENFLSWISETSPITLSETNAILEDIKANFYENGINDLEKSDVFKQFSDLYYKYRDDTENNGSNLQKFWASYLNLCELLLNLIYATRVGDWELYLSCIEEVIPWAFAYDRQKYARYLLPFLNDMRGLPTAKAEVYGAFCQGEFSVQMEESNTFGRNEADKTIENTINRDCKTSGGYIGFSTNFPATQRWVLNAARRGQYKHLLREHIGLNSKKYVHKELAPGTIRKDIAAVDKIIKNVDDVFQNPWEGEDLISLSTGIVASPSLVDDLLNARANGMDACMSFLTNRSSSTSELGFFDVLTKTNLMTFSKLRKVVNIRKKDGILPLKMDRTLFARMTLLAQFRNIDLKLVFTYPLGPLPWSIADPFGLPRKTNKSQLLHKFEEGVLPVDRYPTDASTIYDGMAVLQKLNPPAGSDFGKIAEMVFNTCTSTISSNVHIVFDVYKEISIKNAERSKRNSNAIEGIRYKNILPSYPVKSWKKVLAIQSNKTEVVRFLVSEWKKSKFTENIKNRNVYVTEGSCCWRISENGAEIVPELACSHEEADTRMLLHAQYADGPTVIHADDTDVFILLVAFSGFLPNVYMKLGKGSKARIVKIDTVKRKLLEKLHSDVSPQEFIRSLIGIFAFTGCDTISAFAGKGKMKAVNLLLRNPDFASTFSVLGNTWTIPDEVVNSICEFVCSWYGKPSKDVDLLRYQLYCSKGGKVEPEALPPCKGTLLLHIMRSNYQAGIWKRSLCQMPDIPSPADHGWEIDGENISIKWLSTRPAPEEVIDLMSCECKKTCKVEECCCVVAKLKCTDLCKIKCDNTANEIEENVLDDEESDVEEDI